MIAQAFLAEFENEQKITRRFLERLPADKLTWKPHPKSLSAGQLALHIAGVPGAIAELTSADTGQVPDFNKPFPEATSVDEVLKAHDASAEKVRKILPTFDDGKMHKMFQFKAGDKVAMELPRVAAVRVIMLNHWIQHRGQFGVYLRLLGAKVPASYGPSGDEAPAM